MENFLSEESGEEAKREQYAEEAHATSLATWAIEDAFAHAVGPEAVETLRQLRARDYRDFSYEGRLAPDGHYFSGWPYGDQSFPRGQPLPPPPPPIPPKAADS